MEVNKLLIGILLAGIGAILFFNAKTGSKTETKQQTALANFSSESSLTTQELTIGSTAPDFRLTTLDKETFRLDDKKGKTVILFGVAGWCGECIPEGKALTQIKRDYADKGVEIIGVAFTKGDNDALLNQYKQVGSIDIPLAIDTDNAAGKYQIKRLETTYIVNKNGKIAYKDEQFTSYDDYKKELDKIL